MSARNVSEAIDTRRYAIKYVNISKSGEWRLVDSVRNATTADLAVSIDLVHGQFYAGGKLLSVDLIFPVLHGKNGEDGTVQGIAKVAHIPIVGPSLIGAAVTMDKDLTKRVLMHAGIPIVRWHTWHTFQPRPAYSTIKNDLGKVLFVKPANAGSSVGVSKVRNEAEFDKALDFAAQHDSIVLIEQAVDGREAQISILGNEHPTHTEICEVESMTDFHDFEDKYSETSTAKFHIPARISSQQADRIKQYALQAYSLTRGRGMARVDFFIIDDDTEYLNEINSIPGFTNVSVYPKLWREAGLLYVQLIDKLIELALE